MKKKKSVLKKIGITFAVIFVVLLGMALLAVCGSASLDEYSEVQAEEDALLASEIIDMISDSVVDEEGNVPEIAEITIPTEHFNAFLRSSAYKVTGLLKKEIGEECALGLTWEKKSVHAVFNYPVPVIGSIVANASATPVFNDGELEVHIRSLRIGWLPLLFGFTVNVSDKIHDDTIQEGFDAIQRLLPDEDGNLTVRIYPEKISNLIRALAAGED